VNGLRTLLVCLALSLTAVAQGPSVTALPLDVVAVPKGGSAIATLTFRVSKGFHINSNKPNSDLLIPTVLKLSPQNDLMVGKIEYPKGEDLTFEFSPDEKMSVYSGDFTVKALVRSTQNAAPGTYRINGQLKYQACNDRQCFPPKTAPVALDVKVAKRARQR